MMKLTAQRVFDVTQTLATVINEKRPMPLKGAYRLSRLHAKLKPEFDTIRAKRDEIITGYGHKAVLVEVEGEPEKNVLADSFSVPADKLEDFIAKWGEIAGEEVEIAYDPIPLSMLDLGDKVPSPLTALELSSLGDLIADETG